MKKLLRKFRATGLKSLKMNLLLIVGLLVVLPILLWAVSQKTELRKKAVIDSICWDRVIENEGGYSWPDGCKGMPPRENRACTLALVALSEGEIVDYQKWAEAGKSPISGCGSTPSCVPKPPCMEGEPANDGQVYCATMGAPPPGTVYCPEPSCIPLPECSYNPPIGANGKPIFCSPPAPPEGKHYCPRPTPGCVPLPPCFYQGETGPDGQLIRCALNALPLPGPIYCPPPTPTPLLSLCKGKPDGSKCTLPQTCPVCDPNKSLICPMIACIASLPGSCRNGQCITVSPPPPGCYFQQVQCIQAPCDPILICPDPTPPSITPVSCVRSVPMVTIGPPSVQIGASRRATFTVRIKNTDSIGCGASKFDLATAGPIDFIMVQPLPPMATISPGSTVSYAMALEVAGASYRQYIVSVTATNIASGKSGAGQALMLLSTPTPTLASASPTPAGKPISWKTPYALLSASSFFIRANNKTFTGAPTVNLSSDPPGFPNAQNDRTTLEAIWNEQGVEMRLFIYFSRTGNVWKIDELRTYDGQAQGDWFYYQWPSGSAVGTPVSTNFLDLPATNGSGVLSFRNMVIQPSWGTATITPTTRPTPTPSYRPIPSDLTCFNKPVLTVNPQSRSAKAGQSVTYDVTLQNTDVYPCNPIQFDLIAPADSGWSTTLSTTPITLSAGSQWSGTLTARSPQNTGAGNYTIPIEVRYRQQAPIVLSTVTYTVASPSQQTLEFKLKFDGVSDGAATGAKVTIRLVNATTDLTTPALAVTHLGSGVYQAKFILGNALGAGEKYQYIVKGEKHIATKFCKQVGQSGPCSTQDGITVPNPSPLTYGFDFTSIALPPGDVYPQNGKADAEDFNKIKALMTKSCSALTDSDTLAGDLDYNGCVNIRDAFLMRKTLETRYDEQ